MSLSTTRFTSPILCSCAGPSPGRTSTTRSFPSLPHTTLRRRRKKRKRRIRAQNPEARGPGIQAHTPRTSTHTYMHTRHNAPLGLPPGEGEGLVDAAAKGGVVPLVLRLPVHVEHPACLAERALPVGLLPQVQVRLRQRLGRRRRRRRLGLLAAGFGGGGGAVARRAGRGALPAPLAAAQEGQEGAWGAGAWCGCVM